MKMPKDINKYVGVAGNVMGVVDMGMTAYDVCTGKKPAKEVVKKVSGKAVALGVGRGLAMAGLGAGIVPTIIGFVAVTATEKIIDYVSE